MKIQTLSLIFFGTIIFNTLAMANPTVPSGPLPKDCLASNTQLIGSFTRERTDSYRLSSIAPCTATLACLREPPPPQTCYFAGTTYSIDDADVMNACLDYARNSGSALATNGRTILCADAGDGWIQQSSGGACSNIVWSDVIAVSAVLTPEETQAKQCNQLQQCVLTAPDSSSIQLIAEWKQFLNCQ